MKTVSATEAKQRFAALIDAAQREPVVIQRQNRDVAILISPEEWDRIRGHKRKELEEVWARIGRQADAAGLTDAKLAELLADDADRQ